MENKVAESRGYWEYTRIGRPDVVYDQRSKYTTNIDEYNRAMKERQQIYNKETVTSDVELDFPLPTD